MFVSNLVTAMRPHCDVLHVVAPIPYAPPLSANTRWKRLRTIPAEESVGWLRVSHPRFLAVPGLQALNGLTYGVRVLLSLWRLKQLYGPFFVHGHCAYPDGVGVAIAARCLGLTYAITAHGSDINVYAQRWALQPQIRWALRGATGIVAVSDALTQRIRNLLKDDSSQTNVAHIPCAGFDPSIFTSADAETPRVGDGRTVVFVGHLVPIKGLPFLIRAWHQLVTAGSVNASDRLVIVGDGPERSALEEMCRSTGVESSVHFTGLLAPVQVAARVRSAHLLCLPSLNEGTPNVVVEALACGVPVVASRVGGIPDLIRDGSNGWLAEPGDSAALAAALAEVLGRQWSAKEMRQSVRQMTWDALARRNVAFLRKSTGALA